MKHPKKFLKKLIIPGVVLALGLFTLIGAKAGIFNGTKPRGGNGGNDADRRGTDNNPFVILEIAPSFGTDNISWTSNTNKTATYDNMQVMRWGVGSEVASILSNPDLLHNTTACETLRDNGVVTLSAKHTGNVISKEEYDALNSDLRKFYTEKTTNQNSQYYYMRRSKKNEPQTKLIMVIDNLTAQSNNQFEGFITSSGGPFQKSSMSGHTVMVYVGNGNGNYKFYPNEKPGTYYVHFYNAASNSFPGASIGDTSYFVVESSNNKPNDNKSFSSAYPTQYSEYYVQYYMGKETINNLSAMLSKDYILLNNGKKTVTTYTEADHYDQLTSTNLFAKEVLHSANPANTKVQVVSITAENLKNNKDLIDRADLIVINGDSNKDYGGYGESGKDFDAATIIKIYSKVSRWNLPLNTDGCPIVINNAVLTKTPSSGNSRFNLDSCNHYKVRSDGVRVKFGSFQGFNNYAYKLALMLHVMDDENFVTIYLQNQLKTPRVNSSNGEYVIAKVGSSQESLVTNNYYYNTDYTDRLATYWSANVFAPIHLTDLDAEYILDEMFNKYGWRSDNNQSVVEDEYWLYATTETDWMKFFYKDVTTYKTAYKKGYTTEHLFEYIYPTRSDRLSRTCSPLEIIDFLINKGYDFVPTPSVSPSPSATPSATPTPYEISIELHANDHGKVQAGTAAKGKDSIYNYTVTWQDHQKDIIIACLAEADSNSHFVGWYTSDTFSGTAESIATSYNKTIKALQGNKAVLYAYFVTNTPTPTPTNTPSPTPTPRIEQGVRVLEVQAYSMYESAVNWSTMMKSLYGSNSQKYTVVDKVTIKEFISHVEDLRNNYDMIYFGLKTNSYYDNWVVGESFAKTYWTHVISHTGPLLFYNKNSRIGGLANINTDLNLDSGTLRTYLSGNDITEKKYRELVEFMKGNGVIVFASDFYKNGAIDTSKVDTNSYLYKLLNGYKGTDKVVVYGSQTTNSQSKFRGYQQSKFVSMDFTIKPAEYRESESDVNRYINGKNDADRVLKFKFTIQDNKTINDPYYYEIGLYVDLNADGRFNSSEAESLKGATVIDKTTNKQLEEGQKLQSWHVYEVTRDVSELVGVVPWKIELSRTNSDITTSETGFSAIKARDDERVTIRVLQIHENGKNDSEKFDGADNHITYMLPTTDDLKRYATRTGLTWSTLDELYSKCYNQLKSASIDNDSDARNLQESDIKMYDSQGAEIKFDSARKKNAIKTTQKYFILFQNLNEFSVRIDRISCKSFNEWSKTHKLIDNYDMVILGFSDGFSDLEDNAGKNLNDFINTGRSVLFAHDTASFANYKTTPSKENGRWRNDWYWGYNITQMFRARLGMDRYNVKGRNATSYVSDPDYVQDSIKTISAYTGKFRTADRSYSDYNNGVYNQGYNDLEIVGNKKSRQESTLVENVNKGAITVYPYLIGDRINVSNTHCQYYQLDMENPNIVVWYTLASNSSTNAFYLDPKDGQNGYYIYNIGNITYTGAGHSVDHPNNVIDELKLFVNTVVAAYRAAGSPVDTYITNDEKTSGDNIDYLYIDFDSNNTTLAVGEGIAVYENKQSKQVTFTVEDNSIIDTQKIEVNYYIQKSNVDMLQKNDLENAAYWNAINFDTFNVKGSGSGKYFDTKDTNTRSKNGITYYTVYDRKEYGFYLPLELIEASSSMMIRIQTTITYGSEADGNLSTITTDKYVEVLRRGFFNLD